MQRPSKRLIVSEKLDEGKLKNTLGFTPGLPKPSVRQVVHSVDGWNHYVLDGNLETVQNIGVDVCIVVQAESQ